MAYLKDLEIQRLQVLDRFFYEVQIPRLLPICHIHRPKTRLHLLNQDYIILFEMLNFTKRKFQVGFNKSMFPLVDQHDNKLKSASDQIHLSSMWNYQSIEVKGRIFITGGAIAN